MKLTCNVCLSIEWINEACDNNPCCIHQNKEPKDWCDGCVETESLWEDMKEGKN